MSDQNPRKSQTSRATADQRDELSEEVFAWVVSDTSELPEVQTEGSHAAPDGRARDSGGYGNRQLMVSASALARHMGAELSELHSQPARPGAEPGSDWLASSGLAPLPQAHPRGSGAGHPGFTHALPGMGTGQNVGYAIIPNVSPGGSGHASGQLPSHIVSSSQPSGPAIAGLIPGGKEGSPVPVLISVTNGNNTPGGSTVTIAGLPPGTIMNLGHAGPGGTWILGPGTDLKNLTMTPPTDWFGSGHLTATVVDPNGHSAQIQMPFNVLPQPDAARISGTDTGTTSEDRVLTVSGGLTIVDPDPGEAHFQASTLRGNFGRLQIDQSGHWTYTLDNTSPSVQALISRQTERETFTIHSVDGTSHQLVVNVMGTDDTATIAGTAVGAVTEDKLTSTGGKLDVTDPDAGQDQFVPQTGAAGAHGSFTVQPDGTWSYALDNGQPAVQALKTGDQITDTLTVSTIDGTTKQITVSINGTDDTATIGGVDTGNVSEGSRGKDMSPDYAQPGMATLDRAPLYADGKLTIIDPDAGEAEFDTKGLGFTYHGKYGDLMLNADGNWHYHADAGHTASTGGLATTHGRVIDQLGAGQSLTDTITVYAKDGTAHDITITIHGSNDRPYCSSEVALSGGTEDTTQTLTKAQLLSNTVEVDANDAGKLSLSGLRADHGSIRDNGDGTFTFTPEKDYSGAVHFTYDVKDAHGGVTHTGATTTLAAVGDAAVITGTDTGSATEDKVHGRIVISGDLDVTDPDGPGQEHFQYSQFGEHAVSDPFGGSLHISSAGTWSYVTDNSNAAVQQLAAGQVGHATYRVSSADGTTHQIQITIHGTNDAPVLSAATASATEDGSSVSGQMSATDVDTGDTLAYSLGQAAPAGFTLNADGSWSFDPTDAAYQHLAAGATQQVTIPVTVTDGTATDTQNLTITVTGTNDGPAVSGPVTLPGGTEDKSVQITVTQLIEHATDIDTGDQLSVAGLTASHGTITGDAATGFTFTPDANYNGTITLSYQVTDGQGGTTAQTASLTLGAVGDPAVITDAMTGFVKEDENVSTFGGSGGSQTHKLTATGLLSIVDPDAGEDHFRHGPGGETAVSDPFGGHLRTDANGSWVYTVDNDNPRLQQLAAGQVEHAIYRVHSIDGTAHDIDIEVRGTNDAPTVSAAVVLPAGTEDKAVQITAAQLLEHSTDIDTGDQLSVTGLSASHGTITGDAATGFTFTPDPNYNGPVSLSYQVTDGHGGTVPQTAALTLGATPDAAVITGGGASLKEDVNVGSYNKLSAYGQFHVVDPDGPAESQFPDRSFQTYTGSLGGSLQVNPDGQYIYNLDNSIVDHLKTGEEAKDHFVIHSVDGTTHPVEFTIAGTNDAPVVYRDTVTRLEGANVVNGHIYAGDRDHDDSKTLTFTSGAPVAGFHLNSDGSYSFDPSNAAYSYLNDGDQKTISIPITVTDRDGLKSTGSLTVHLIGRDDTPVLSAATALATEDGKSVSGHMSATDADNSPYTLQYSLGQTAPAGFTLNADGSWTFDPTDAAYQHLAAGQTDQITIPVTVTDKQGATDTENLVITVTGTNDGPAVQTGDLGATQPGAGKTLSATDLLAAVHATDIDTGDQLSISNVQVDPQYGSFHQSGSNWVFTPTTGASQTDVPVTISVTDGHSTSSTTATLDVTAAPTPPTATQVHGSGTTHLSGTLTGGTGGWSIDNGHGGALSLQGQYGTLTIDPKTGHFEYDYRAQSAVIKSGGGGMPSGHHTDTFHILQHGTHTSDADVQVNINVQSVHGNSGHHVDHTTLIGIDIVPTTPPQHDAPSNDEPIFEVTLDDDAQGPSAAGLGLTGEMDVSLATRADSADDPAGHDNRGFEPSNEHLGENPPPTHHIDPVNHYLDAVGASLHSDVPDQPQDAEQANPYTEALGVDADIPTDAPMLDPSMLDDPATATDLNSGSATSDEGIELPPDEPLVSLPEEDDPSANSG